MSSTTDRQLIACGFGRLEAPTMTGPERLLVSDITLGGVHEIDLRSGARQTVVAHRKGIGGICPHTQGIIVSGRNVAVRHRSGQSQVLLEADAARGVTGFNDMTADRQGRLYVGALSFTVADGWDTAKRPGLLYRIDLDGTVAVMDDDLLLPNGMAFSADDRTYYQSDSLRHVVYAYPVSASGEFGPRRLFAKVPDGLSDGMAVAQDGSVLVAAAYAGAVYWFEPDGSLRTQIKFESPMVTSVCFTLDSANPELIVTTGPEGADPALGGAIYRLQVGMGGVEKHIARVVG